MTLPLISIVTPCFNSAGTIERTIVNVLNQSYTNWEYIIVDGLSTDGTLAIIEKYAKTNPRIKFIHEKDAGIYDAMNKGIKLCTGEIIGIINSDDWYELDTFQIIADEYTRHGSGVYYGIQRKVLNDKEFCLERQHHGFLDKGMIPHSASFITKDIYQKHGLFDTQYRYVADYDLMVRLRNLNVFFKSIEAVLSNFSIGGTSSGYKATMESLTFKYKNRFLNRKSYLIKKMKVLIINKYLKR